MRLISTYYSGRHLPHYQSEHRTYFVTFVTKQRRELPPLARDIILKHVVQKCSDMGFLHRTCVMPEHVHLIVTPGWNDKGVTYAVSQITRAIKGASAREVNLAMGWSASLWQKESFDHELRRDESLREKCEYIRQNPVRRGLVADPDDYPWTWPKD